MAAARKAKVKKAEGRKAKKTRVYFEIEAPEAREVVLCGSFSGWDRAAKPLKQNKGGKWRTFRMRAMVNRCGKRKKATLHFP